MTWYRCFLMFVLVSGAWCGGLFAAHGSPPQHRWRIAFLAAGAQNGYNQSVWNGIQAAAARAGNVDVRLFDGGFDSTLQYNQVEDVVASHHYDGIILFPNDTVSIASAVAEAAALGMPTVALNFPIGPDLEQITPQTRGVVSTVATAPAVMARRQAEDVGLHCRARPVCNVLLLIGQKVYPFDQLRYRVYRQTLASFPNVRIVATIEGQYDAGTAMNGVLDRLQVDRHIDAVLSTADIQTIGAEMAFKSYGIDPAGLYLSSAGGSGIGVRAVREGRWAVTYGTLTRSMGEASLDAIVGAVSGRKIPPVIDADSLSPLPPLWTRDILLAHPAFQAQWAG
ncbi:sugar ABC transporter substrate-binding protein [Gluconacetobacter sp. Hr-1-5]|uniref:sugar ABC transporter substrate-binding protein n=1 Tax=Gluconacetobacter sp. Hr-1-5 TaxID=3395370 RepID=UPI003B51F092